MVIKPIPGQVLSTRLDVPLPYLLHRAQARYEQDLRRLQDIKPVVSTAAPPRALMEDNRPSLSRRISSNNNHLESGSASTIITKRPPPLGLERPTLLRSAPSSSRNPTTPSATRLATLPSLPASQRLAAPVFQSTSSSSSSSSSESGAEGEEERTKEQQVDMGRKLKELERLIGSGTLGFARPPNRPTVLPSSPLQPVPPPPQQPAVVEPPREPRFDREREQPSSSSSSTSPADSPRLAQQQDPLVTTVVRPRKAAPTRLMSEGSSQSSQASSFSDISGQWFDSSFSP